MKTIFDWAEYQTAQLVPGATVIHVSCNGDRVRWTVERYDSVSDRLHGSTQWGPGTAMLSCFDPATLAAPSAQVLLCFGSAEP